METRSVSLSTTPTLPYAFLESTSSIHLEPTTPSTDDDDGHDLAPLLPQHRIVPRKPDLTPRPLSRLVVAFAALFSTTLALWALFTSSFRRSSPIIYDKGSLDATRHFLRDPSTVNQGLIPFPPYFFSPLLSTNNTKLPPTLASSSFPSRDCLEAFIAEGRICDNLSARWSRREDQPKLDLIWSWTNGSEAELMSSWKNQVSEGIKAAEFRKPGGSKAIYRLAGGKIFKHFREHDELRFSIRSALESLSSTSIASLHLVVGDTPSHMAGISPFEIDSLAAVTARLGTSEKQQLQLGKSAQIPHWVDLATLEFGATTRAASAGPPLRIHSHSEVFKLHVPTEEEARVWQDSVVPSFNSLAIESQLANLELDSPTAVYLNDDFFLNEPLSVSDFESPLTGPVFRMQRDLVVRGTDPKEDKSDPESEWKSLGTAAYLLDRRFGRRSRPYLVHVAKTVSVPMLKEVQAVFLEELTQTAEARFRGKGVVEAQTMHLLVHYTVEKHREALLWSYLVGRSNPATTGFYSPSERSTILSELNPGPTGTGSSISVYAPLRSSSPSLLSHFSTTGLPPPKSTQIQFSSADGYAYFDLDNVQHNWPTFEPNLVKRREFQEDEGAEGPAMDEAEQSTGSIEEEEEQSRQAVCELDLESCFGTDFFDFENDSPISVHDTLKRIAFEQPRCGDCLIVKLLGKSGEKGLEAFLPRKEKEDSSAQAENLRDTVSLIPTVGLGGTQWEDLEYEWEPAGNETRRDFALSLIQRYSYAIGESASAFRSIRHGGEGLSLLLDALSFSDANHEPPAFLALNDDIRSFQPAVLRDVDRRMGDWFRKVWPNPSPWELS